MIEICDLSCKFGSKFASNFGFPILISKFCFPIFVSSSGPPISI